MLLPLLALLAGAAEPSDRWRTVETAHFRMHYPLKAEAWALQAAERLEAMRARVRQQVGGDLDRKVTVVVRDPVSASNGMALPFLRRPRTELWLTPPGASSVIGWNRRWDEGLIVHEDTHLVHLAQPARGGLDRLLDGLTGVGPIARKAPRWVIEGYATVVEGDQTGFGRPFAATEAAAIRRLASEGRLPAYGELSGSSRWQGMGFAYGFGNAYLRWLRDRAGPDSLRHLWQRLTAKRGRSFEDAFAGVFGDSPESLYGRFIAETTAAAMALEAERPPIEDTRWIDLEEGSGQPALSPDGTRIAMVTTDHERGVLCVWRSDFDESEAQEAWDQSVADLLARDPLDVPAVRRPEPVLERPIKRHRRDRPPSEPRWIGNHLLLFSARVPDATNRLRRDLFVWSPDTRQERRVTNGADLHSPDPYPDGKRAIAVHQAWGSGCLARVDLRQGSMECLTKLRPDVIIDAPRVHPDGDRVLWLQQADGPWTLWTAGLDAQGLVNPAPVPSPSGAQLASPTWHPDGEHIVVSLGLPHLQEIASVDPKTGTSELWTRSHGGATAPAVNDTHLYWLNEDAEGLDLHRSLRPGTEGATTPEPLPPAPDLHQLAQVREAPSVEPLSTVPVESRPYGLGRQESRGLASGQASRDEARVVLGLRLGDVIGRHETLVIGGLHRQDGETTFGIRANTAFRSLPADVLVQAWLSEDAQTQALRMGAGLALQDRTRWSWGAVGGQVGGFADPGLGDAADHHAAHAALDLAVWEPTGRWASLQAHAQATAGALRTDGPGAWLGGEARLGLYRGSLTAGARLDAAAGDAPDLSLGGLPDPFLPDMWQADRIRQPGLAPGAATGRTHLGLDATLGSPLGGLFVARHSVSDRADLTSAHTLVGLRGTATVAAQPLAGTPRAISQFGIACRVTDPITGVPDKVCRSLDHWTAWLGVRWRVD